MEEKQFLRNFFLLAGIGNYLSENGTAVYEMRTDSDNMRLSEIANEIEENEEFEQTLRELYHECFDRILNSRGCDRK